MSIRSKWCKFLGARLFGVGQDSQQGLVVLDKISAEVISQFRINAVVGVTDESLKARVLLPSFKYIVAPNAVDTLTRTPEEIYNRIAGVPDRAIHLLAYKPGVDLGKWVSNQDPQVTVVFNEIIKTATGAYYPKFKRLYTRIEEDMIRAALENGLSPRVVRFNGTVATRARFIRLAKEYQGVQVWCDVLNGGQKMGLTKHEQRVVDSWVMPSVDEGLTNVAVW